MPSLPSSRCGPRRGAIAVQVALSLTALLGVAALVLDAGLLMTERRHAQAAADAAALAAAIDLSGDVSPYTATKLTATNVGTTNYADTSHLTVTPNIPPLYGTFSDTVKYPTGTKSAVTATGGSSIIPGSAFIADTLTINGSGTMNLPLPSVPVPIPGAGQKVGLVE